MQSNLEQLGLSARSERPVLICNEGVFLLIGRASDMGSHRCGLFVCNLWNGIRGRPVLSLSRRVLASYPVPQSAYMQRALSAFANASRHPAPRAAPPVDVSFSPGGAPR